MSLDGNEPMITGDFEGLQSSGKGFGMDETEEEKDSLLTLEKWELKIKSQKRRREITSNNL